MAEGDDLSGITITNNGPTRVFIYTTHQPTGRVSKDSWLEPGDSREVFVGLNVGILVSQRGSCEAPSRELENRLLTPAERAEMEKATLEVHAECSRGLRVLYGLE